MTPARCPSSKLTTRRAAWATPRRQLLRGPRGDRGRRDFGLSNRAGEFDYGMNGVRPALPVVDHCGTISANQNWGPHAVHRVTCSVTVASGVKLPVLPGTVVKIQSHDREDSRSAVRWTLRPRAPIPSSSRRTRMTASAGTPTATAQPVCLPETIGNVFTSTAAEW